MKDIHKLLTDKIDDLLRRRYQIAMHQSNRIGGLSMVHKRTRARLERIDRELVYLVAKRRACQTRVS